MYKTVTRGILLSLLLASVLSLLAITATAQTPGDGASSSQSLQRLLEESNSNDILTPEQAYRFTAQVASGNQLRLKWVIADRTYLYQERLQVKITHSDGVTLGEYQLPPAKIKKDALRPDGSTGDLPVYYHGIELLLPLIRTNTSATSITLQVKYQGCADQGVCYPPQIKSVTLELPASDATAAGSVATSSEDAQPTSELDGLIATLNGGNYWLIIGIFFLAGLGLALTPCIFPMIPILSGIIIGQGKEITTARAFSISLAYVLAMSAVYTMVGVLAGVFGGNLQATFQNPWILSIFAGVFVLLALSMFGLYDLQLPSALQNKLTEISNRQRGGTLIGAAVMGALSALIVGPCVAPALAAAVLVIGQSGDPILGGTALFAVSIGMGLPLLIFGVSAGKLLPQVGAWMDIVKSVFGVGMLAVAMILLERILPATVSMFLWGTLLVVSAIYMGALHELAIEASGWQRLWKGLGVTILIYGALMLVGAAAGGGDTVQPLRGIAMFEGSASQQQLAFKPIKSERDLERELAAAVAQHKPVMLDFYADWCISCKELERYTFSDPKVIKSLAGFVLLRADVTANDATDQALLHGRFGMPGPPSIMFFDRSGNERKQHRIVGFMSADEFIPHVIKAVE
ncbi:MAG: protein-disulfide reductase DsbD [Gammaproteobacteria bacterium]